MAKISPFALVSSCKRTKESDDFVTKPDFDARPHEEEITDTTQEEYLNRMNTTPSQNAEKAKRPKLVVSFEKGNAEKMVLRQEYVRVLREYAELFEDCFLAQGHVWACPLPSNFPTEADVLLGNIQHTPLRTVFKNLWHAYDFLYTVFVANETPKDVQFLEVRSTTRQEQPNQEQKVDEPNQPQSLHDLLALFVEAAASQMLSANETNMLVLRHVLAVAETGNVEISVKRPKLANGVEISILKDDKGQIYAISIIDGAEEIEISYRRGPKKTASQENTPENQVDA